MKTIGLLGGMSWQSTQSYYQIINQQIAIQKGGLHSAKIAMVSVDFAPIAKMQAEGRWQEMGDMLCVSARQIEAAGAECLLICTNTMHLLAEQIEQAISIPLIHIADATAKQLVADSISKVALLGTAFTMQKPFYKQRIEENYGIEVIVPTAQEQETVHRIIYEELCLGKIKEVSKKEYVSIVKTLKEKGAEGVILGCTEIGMLLKPEDSELPLFDTTKLHAFAAVDFALRE